MALQQFEVEYLQDKDLLYFEEYDQQRRMSPHQIYVAESITEMQEILEELNIPQAKFYNSITDTSNE